MAKISSYITVTPPVSGSDMLIGTDVADNNATKNFTVSQLASFINAGSGFVPYTGATADVDLGTFNLYTNDLYVLGSLYLNGSQGASGEVLTSQGPGLPPIWQAGGGAAPGLNAVLTTGNTATDNLITLLNTINSNRVYISSLWTPPQPFPVIILRYDTTTDGATLSITADPNRAIFDVYQSYLYPTGDKKFAIEIEDNNQYQLKLPNDTNYLVTKVNGNAADPTGNVTISTGASYLVYTALLDYNGGAITANILENTLGTTINWSNPANGLLFGTAASGNPFTLNRTWVVGGSYDNGGQPYFTVGSATIFTNIVSVRLFLYDGTSTGTPNFSNLQVEIRVYP